MIAAAGKGLYQPGETLLHRLDPRVKVVVTLVLVMLTFAASSWGQIVVVTTTLAIVLYLVSTHVGALWRMLWFLRWLLLFTFLLHLFFTPGRTLLGLSWLSYDGLLVGCYVCMQLITAVMLASVMVLTTSIEGIVGAFGWFVKPLSKVGINTSSWERISLLALNFVPIVYDQIGQSSGDNIDDDTTQKTAPHRWFSWTGRLNSLVLRLVDRGDEIAHQLVIEGDSQKLSDKLPALLPMTLLDKLFLVSLLVVLIGYSTAAALL